MNKRLSYLLGGVLIFFGVFVNAKLLATLFSRDGVFDSLSLNIRILLLQSLLILSGLYIIIYQHKKIFRIYGLRQIWIGGGGIACGILCDKWVLVHVLNIQDSSFLQGIVWIINTLFIIGGIFFVLLGLRLFSLLKNQFVLTGLSTLLSFVAIESFLLLIGYEPYRLITSPGMTVVPGGRLFRMDPTLGYTFLPGQYRITLPGNYTFTATNLTNTLRITHPLQTYTNGQKKEEIWIFGCSFTYGWALNDHETFSWVLQEKLPEYEVVNFGVSGYGTVQPFLQFQEALKYRKIPKAIIVAYASFHDERNALFRRFRKLANRHTKFGPFLARPYARLDKQGQLHYQQAKGYDEIPFIRYSALMNLVDDAYNSLEQYNHNPTEHDVSKAVMKNFFAMSKSRGIQFIVAGIIADSRTRDMLEFCKQEGMITVDISVDLSIPEYSNYPYDNHPSAIANRQYANKLAVCLESL